MNMLKGITLDEEIQRCLNEMNTMKVDSDEYSVAVGNLEILQGLQKENNRNKYVISPEVAVTAITNILGILLVINHEKINVITTRAFSLIRRN